MSCYRASNASCGVCKGRLHYNAMIFVLRAYLTFAPCSEDIEDTGEGEVNYLECEDTQGYLIFTKEVSPSQAFLVAKESC